MILVCFTRQALATVNRAAHVTLTMCCLTAINQLVKRKVLTMAEYIEREALQAALMRKRCGVANQRYTEGWNDCLLRVKSMVSKAPAADVVPVSELLTLRDALYENDQITMRGLARLNMLIAKYGGYDHG